MTEQITTKEDELEEISRLIFALLERQSTLEQRTLSIEHSTGAMLERVEHLLNQEHQTRSADTSERTPSGDPQHAEQVKPATNASSQKLIQALVGLTMRRELAATRVLNQKATGRTNRILYRVVRLLEPRVRPVLLLTTRDSDDIERGNSWFIRQRIEFYLSAGIRVFVFHLDDDGTSVKPQVLDGIEFRRGSKGALENYLASKPWGCIISDDLSLEAYEVIESCNLLHSVIHWPDLTSFNPVEAHGDPNRLVRNSIVLAKAFSDSRVTNVFTSRYLLELAQKSVGRTPATAKVIQSSVFRGQVTSEYEGARQKRVLCLCRAMTPKDATDLVVRTLSELSKNESFNLLEFSLIALDDNALELAAPLRKFPNVTVEFNQLSVRDAALLCPHFGVLFYPTYWEAHGLEFGLAMNAGTVVVTNSHSAVNHYVDNNCAIVTETNEVEDLANALLTATNNESLYQRISEAGKKRVARQRADEFTVEKETALLRATMRYSLRKVRIRDLIGRKV